MAEPLSPADRSSLAAEQGPVNMTVGGVLILEDGAGLAHDAILERVSSRLHLIPRYRQKLAQPAPGVTNPVWIDDEGSTSAPSCSTRRRSRSTYPRPARRGRHSPTTARGTSPGFR
jgi:wax ester synthase-like acyl-CoA acyltransferase family protein